MPDPADLARPAAFSLRQCAGVVVFWCMLLAGISAASADDAAALVANAHAQVGQTLIYDASYQSIAYPMGDVPISRGVCSDVVIRALRGVGIDLQAEIHQDMAAHFSAYPANWGLKRTDRNIDHRRVPNLVTFFTRQGKALPVSAHAEDYRPGDIVTWRLSGGLPHIGIVSDRLDPESKHPMIIHNIGWGTREEDGLFAYQITGHYRWFP